MGFGLVSCKKYAVIILASRAGLKVAIAYTKLLGQVTRALNIQNNKGKAKSYQVRQVLLAIEKLEINRED